MIHKEEDEHLVEQFCSVSAPLLEWPLQPNQYYHCFGCHRKDEVLYNESCREQDDAHDNQKSSVVGEQWVEYEPVLLLV